MAKSKTTTEPSAEQHVDKTATASAGVMARLAARMAEAKNDWESLIAEAAAMDIMPPVDVLDDLGRRLDIDQPRFQFRAAVDAFKTAMWAVTCANSKRAAYEATRAELGPREQLAADITAAEDALVAARKKLQRLDLAMNSVHVPGQQFAQIMREYGHHFTQSAVENAVGQKLPTPRRK